MIGQFGVNFAYMGGFIITPLLAQREFGYSVAGASLAMAVRPLVNSMVSPGAGYLATRVGERKTSVWGVVLVVVSMGCFVVAALASEMGFVFAGLALSGVGLGACGPSLITVAANAVETDRLGVANAAQQMVSQIGAVVGIQALSTIVATSEGTDGFAIAYGAGAVVAALSIFGAAAVQPLSRRAELRVAPAA